MSARQKIGRLALFLLCVVILNTVVGLVVFSFRGVDPSQARTFAFVSTALSVLIGYTAAYKPGWLFKMLTASDQEKTR